MTNVRNLVPKIGLGLVAAFFLYGWSVAGTSATGSPVEVFGVLGAVLMYAAILATLATVFIAGRRAHRAGSWLWLFAVIFVWPLSYLYALAINPHG
jgi:hypothetical protein